MPRRQIRRMNETMRLLCSAQKTISLAVLRQALRLVAKRFGDVTMADLVAPQTSQSTGLYFFWHPDHDEVVYVGRARSRAIIERVPSHLDVRAEGWFGTLLQRIQEEKGLSDRSAAVPHALALRLSILVADYDNIDMSNAETELRHAYRPTLNRPKTIRHVNCARATLEAIS